MEQIEWMLTEASADEMNLTEDEIYFVLAAGHDAEGFSDAEIEYVLDLDAEWNAN